MIFYRLFFDIFSLSPLSLHFTAFHSTSHYYFSHSPPSFHVFTVLTFRGSLLNFQLSFLNFQRFYRFRLFITIFLLTYYFRNSSISTELCIVFHKDINREHQLKTGRILILMICGTMCWTASARRSESIIFNEYTTWENTVYNIMIISRWNTGPCTITDGKQRRTCSVIWWLTFWKCQVLSARMRDWCIGEWYGIFNLNLEFQLYWTRNIYLYANTIREGWDLHILLDPAMN